MMTGDLFAARKIILATIAPMHSITTVMTLVISPRTAHRTFPPHEHLITTIDNTPTHIIIATTEIDLYLSITNATKETTLDRSGSGHWPQHNRSSSNYWRNASDSLYHHHSSL